VDNLVGADVTATDLRAGAALILCGLVADGITNIGEVYHIQRGYVDIDKKMRALGGDVEIVED
ncbi:MAG: UDP-N-acetylglucosamine 1-carboxyvinyltransferase, partial [Peptostreptococcus porci]|nr:UDP-N-acetylglucosamine 1-carboxyvinyltransferase [Peptostreptococcus porci]